MSEFAPCPQGCGEVIVGEFSYIRVALTNEDGSPMLDVETGEPIKQRYRLPAHRADTSWARQTFDPTGLAPAPCEHGLPEHPNGSTHPFAVSWIRAKYLDVGKGGVKCPVCRGEPAPDDLTTPRNV